MKIFTKNIQFYEYLGFGYGWGTGQRWRVGGAHPRATEKIENRKKEFFHYHNLKYQITYVLFYNYY